MVLEVIQMIANIAVAIAMSFSAVALFLSAKAFTLQRKSLQANLFQDISKRVNELLDKEPYQENKEELENWYIRLFNAFEYFAFFANRDYLTHGMKEYYRSGIEGYCERIEKECPSAAKHFKKAPPGQLNELREYYKELPF